MDLHFQHRNYFSYPQLNLTVLSCFYSNPLIDSSFKTYSLFLLIVVAIAAFAARIFRDDNEGENEKIHRE